MSFNRTIRTLTTPCDYHLFQSLQNSFNETGLISLEGIKSILTTLSHIKILASGKIKLNSCLKYGQWSALTGANILLIEEVQAENNFYSWLGTILVRVHGVTNM